jgi:hypothetical protein
VLTDISLIGKPNSFETVSAFLLVGAFLGCVHTTLPDEL